jgi:parvulin-like peptidyl-prolyl isomerase
MKTVFLALAAFAFSLSVKATDSVTSNGQNNTIVPKPATVPTAFNSLQNAQENNLSMLNYNKTMQVTLDKLELTKLENEIANLLAKINFNELMAQTLQLIITENYIDQVKDLEAAQAYQTLMGNILKLAAKK